jgi:hypothetical protein
MKETETANSVRELILKAGFPLISSEYEDFTVDQSFN